MRKLLISILLAGAAASPALAQDHGDRHDRGDRQQAREQPQQAREEFRAERHDAPPPQAEAPQPHFEAAPEARQRADGVSRWTRDSVQQPGETSHWTREPMQRAGETSRWTRDRADGDLRQSDRPLPNVMRTHTPLIVSNTPVEGSQPPMRLDSRRRVSTNWSSEWRRDNRYDWRGWRDRHRSIFRVGIYYDPFGWGYRPYQVGWRLWPSYYGRQYWIDDPWQYRLPYAPPGTVWVRYWDDALLVDRWSGQVIDVIHNFFW
jgi:Ni/Co efflux regulator RcnB